jgi:hypothetical protein
MKIISNNKLTEKIMKKFFAILAAICLFSVGNVFANGTVTGGNHWSSGDITGNFTLGVFCVPTLQLETTTYCLGDYFAGQTVTAFASATNYTGHELTWDLTGPTGSGVTYTFTGTNGTGTTTLTTGDNDVTGISSTGGSGTSTLDGTWNVPSLAGMSCSTADQVAAKHITFTATSLTTAGTGSQSFAITLSVTCDI